MKIFHIYSTQKNEIETIAPSSYVPPLKEKLEIRRDTIFPDALPHALCLFSSRVFPANFPGVAAENFIRNGRNLFCGALFKTQTRRD